MCLTRITGIEYYRNNELMDGFIEVQTKQIRKLMLINQRYCDILSDCINADDMKNEYVHCYFSVTFPLFHGTNNLYDYMNFKVHDLRVVFLEEYVEHESYDDDVYYIISELFKSAHNKPYFSYHGTYNDDYRIPPTI